MNGNKLLKSRSKIDTIDNDIIEKEDSDQGNENT